MPRCPRLLVAALSAMLLTGCATATPTLSTTPSGETPSPVTEAAAAEPAPTVAPGSATSPKELTQPDNLDEMSLEQRVGQLFVVGTPATAAGPEALDALARRYVGGVFLAGRSNLGVDATRDIVDQLAAASGSPLPLLVATDQEGGEVQVLRGPGFSEIPTAVDQGALEPIELAALAQTWGAELAEAGVNLNLAPIADVVASPETAPGNAPIGFFHREFGYDQQTVEAHAGEIIDGMRVAGVFTTPKHFPGLGLVTQNTDTSAGVTDTQTGPGSPSLGVAETLIRRGADCFMMSTADYEQFDPGVPAAFSPVIVDGLLRETLGFEGVVITDDLSAPDQVEAWSPADRAILAIAAGNDLVLVSALPSVAPEMIDAVIAKAEKDPKFAAKVDAAVARVLALKAKLPKGL